MPTNLKKGLLEILRGKGEASGGGGRGWGRDNGVQKRKVLNESMNKTKISRGMNRGEGGVKTKKTLYGRGMDIFWKTQSLPIRVLMVDDKICVFSS